MDLSKQVTNITIDCLTEEDIDVSSIVSISTLIMLLTSSTLFIAIVKRRRSTRLFEPFLLSIAISDFLLCLTTLPAAVTFSFTINHYKSVEDVSILCIVCGFSLLGLHSAKILTYFAGSIDGYLMVSSRRYRKHFEVEIKSSIAVLIWVLSGVFQIGLISTGIGKHVYHCQLGVCIFQLTDSRVFVAVNSVNVMVLVFSLLATVAAIRKGRKRAVKVAPCEDIMDRHKENEIEENIEMNNYQHQTNDPEEILENITTLTNGCSTEMALAEIENVQEIKDFALSDKELSSCTGKIELFSSISEPTKHLLTHERVSDKSVQTDLHFHEILLMGNEITNIDNAGCCNRNCIKQDTYKESAVCVNPRINSLRRGSIKSYESGVDSETRHCKNEPGVRFDDCELINIGDQSDTSTNNINDGLELRLERVSKNTSTTVNTTVLDDDLKCIDKEPDAIMYAASFGGVRQNIRKNLAPDMILLNCYSHAFAHGISLLIFILCWGPFHCVTILQSIFNIEIPTIANCSLLWLGLTNGVWNVVIYPSISSVLNKNIRIILRQFCKQPN